MINDDKNNKIAGVILAGGQAKRLNGIPKGNIHLKNNTTIIDRIITEFSKSGITSIAISVNNSAHYQKYNLPLIYDIETAIGPIAGIYAGLNYFKEIKVAKTSEFNLDEDFKEAICFAVLANEVIENRPTNLPKVTGAEKPVLLGKICPV